MPGIKASECPALANKAYKVSNTHLRQVHGDVCTDLSRVRPHVKLRKHAKQAHGVINAGALH